MKQDEQLKNYAQSIIHWGRTLKYPVRIYLFGSRLKGSYNSDSDLDVAIEFLDNPDKQERTLRWIDFHEDWEQYLAEVIGVQVDLEMYEGDDSPNLKKYLAENSVCIFESDLD